MPINPPYAGRVAGPMTRTVHDAALAMAVLAGPMRATRRPAGAGHRLGRARLGLRGLHMGLWLDAGWGRR